MKTKKSTWLLIWDLLPENKSVDLYRYNALGNDDGDREETLQDSCSDMIASFNNILATVMTQLNALWRWG